MASRKILLVDDSFSVRVKVERALIEAGYQVIVAADGIEALQQAKMHQPELAILDINMPGMSGYEVCERLRSMGAPWDQLPIVFLTSERTHALELLGKHYGAYLHKSVTQSELVNCVREQFAKCSSSVSCSSA